MGKLVMAYWDCPFCGTKGNRGDTVNCPSCGRARGDVKFYMQGYTEGETREENERGDIEYVDEEKAKTINRNPDWYCSFCNSLNSDNAAFCSNCGATREASESNYFEMLKKKQEREATKAQPAAAQAQAAPKRGSRKPLLIAAVVILAIIGLFTYLNGNKTSGDLTVTALSWTREIQIEENREFSESGWELPAGAEQTGTRREIHHYDQVLDHYESVEVQRSRRVQDGYETYYEYVDRGNGYYEEVERQRPVYRTEYYTETVQEPVYVSVPRYATKYYYNIWRWTESREVTASGEDQNPAWPGVELAEKEREGERREQYRFTVKDKDGRETTYEIAEADWNNLKVNAGLYITAKRTGADAYISDKDGNRIANIRKIR